MWGCWCKSSLPRGAEQATGRNAAVDDGLILANPADKLVRALRLVQNAKVRQEEVKAMTRAQVSAFLKAIHTSSDAYVRRHYPFFLAAARTGMRLGEQGT